MLIHVSSWSIEPHFLHLSPCINGLIKGFKCLKEISFKHRWWVGSISVPGNHQSEQFYLIATSVPHSTVNQTPLETSPDALHSIKDQFCIKFMINHISFTSMPPIPISSTQQHLPILLLPLFPKLQILETVFPLFSLHLCFKKNQGLFYILACLIDLWFLSILLFPLDLISLFLI